MERREQTIRDRAAVSRRSQQATQQEAERYRQLQQEFAAQKTAMLAQAKAEVEQTRKTLLQAVRAEVEATQARWQTAVQQEKDSFLRELRHQVVQQIEQTIRQALTELANVELEQQVINAFLQHRSNLARENPQALQELTASDRELAVHSAFEIPEASRQAILQTLQKQLSTPVHLQFEVTPT